ncbi:hypothetical protein Ahy_A02g007760 [Arachis hypogaea]|uniref:Aminotransferase-like plant mobile domain-containing protein n=1 Tax=Arachis hypogaea TaxID=3818 RepID=A0A445EDC8_ARAHY|nr:hypothetical protein Ahy_A02g007760 [Arachis hypogaea]
MPWGECTITLQDIAYHLRLRTNGDPVGGHGLMPPDTSDPDTLRQYVRCYIMLMIGGYLLTDKLKNTVHLRWLPLLDDFERCRMLSWGSAVLAWTYHSLCHIAHHRTTDIAGCTPLLVSWKALRRNQPLSSLCSAAFIA